MVQGGHGDCVRRRSLVQRGTFTCRSLLQDLDQVLHVQHLSFENPPGAFFLPPPPRDQTHTVVGIAEIILLAQLEDLDHEVNGPFFSPSLCWSDQASHNPLIALRKDLIHPLPAWLQFSRCVISPKLVGLQVPKLLDHRGPQVRSHVFYCSSEEQQSLSGCSLSRQFVH